MTPYYSDAWLDVYQGDCREVMRSLEPESVHCVVTSPPYWGLRDYGQTDQLGLEATPEEYVANLVAVFREVRRVLRNDGTVWLNLGDSYSRSQTTNVPHSGVVGPPSYPVHAKAGSSDGAVGRGERPGSRASNGLASKQLVGIPWRVAFALQADGWYLRSDIIWAKPNPMPESVTDRPTKAHEYLFLLSKSPRYYYDADAVRETYSNGVEAAKPWAANGGVRNVGGRTDGLTRGTAAEWEPSAAGRNLRSVWNIATQPYPGAHFATFPRKLVEPCIKAGTSERGVCPSCGAPWVRVVERTIDFTSGSGKAGRPPSGKNGVEYEQATSGTYDIRMGPAVRAETTGWRPSCGHTDMHFNDTGFDRPGSPEPIPATVLDPFAGSGTTGVVAQSLNRRAILIDLNGDYLVQAMQRNRDIPLGLGAA